MTKETKHEIQIEGFPGFYESSLDSMIDQEIERLFECDGSGCHSNIPDDIFMKADFHSMHIAMAKLYAESFQDWLENNADIKISIPFKDMTSPKYYNFETDRLFCEISESDIQKLYDIADKTILEKLVSDKFTSRDGFSSFYQNSLKDTGQDYKTSWDKPVLDWDHNQLGTLLTAAILSQIEKQTGYDHETEYFQEYHSPDTYSLMENASCNGDITDAVYKGIPQEFLDFADFQREQEKELSFKAYQESPEYALYVADCETNGKEPLDFEEYSKLDPAVVPAIRCDKTLSLPL